MKNISKVYNSAQPFDAAIYIAKKYRVSPAHSRVLVDLGLIGQNHPVYCEDGIACNVGGNTR